MEDTTNTVTTPENNGNVVDNQQTRTEESKNQDGKTFSQEQLNQIIADRLKKYQDYEDLKKFKETAEQANLTELEKLQNKIKELEPVQEQMKSAQKTLEKMLEAQMESIDEDKRALIPKSFSVTEKLNYISQNSAFLMNGKPTIKTPKNDEDTRNHEGHPSLIFGK